MVSRAMSVSFEEVENFVTGRIQASLQKEMYAATYFIPIHTQPYVMDALGTKRGDFAITEHISDRTLAVPFFPNMTGAQVSRVVGALESHFESKSE
jgi:perosamine synthetase